MTVRCGAAVPPHDPAAVVEAVDAVDWLTLPTRPGAERYVSYRSRLVVEVVVPHRYLPADVLLGLSPLVARYGGPSSG